MSFYVSSASGQDNDACGSVETPCQSVQYTIANRATAGDTIRIAAGTYTENVTIPISVTLMGGYNPADWSRAPNEYETIINGATQIARQTVHHPVVEVVNSDAEVVLDGLTLTGGGGKFVGGVLTNDSMVTIRNCYIHHNYADGTEDSQAGAGVLAFHGPALIIENSRIVSNTLGMRPGGAAGIRSHTTPLTLINSVVVDNRGEMAVHTNAAVTITHSTIAHADGGVLVNAPEGALLQILNSIIYGTEWSIGLDGQSSVDVRYTLVEGGYEGKGNLNADPQFVDADNGDYELRANSPAVNAGSANYPNPIVIDLQGRVRDWQPDMGAYELPQVDHDASARGIAVPANASLGQALQPVAAVVNGGVVTLTNPTPVRCTIALEGAPLYTQTVTTAAPWAPFVWQSLELPSFVPTIAGVWLAVHLPGSCGTSGKMVSRFLANYYRQIEQVSPCRR